MTRQYTTIAELRRAISTEMLIAMGLPRSSPLQAMLRPLIWLLAHRFARLAAEFDRKVALPALTEKDFVIERGTVEDMYGRFTLTAIFVARGPRPRSSVPSAAPLSEFVDDSFTREPGYIDPNLRKKLARCFEASETPHSAFTRAADLFRSGAMEALRREIAAAVAKRRHVS